MTALFDPIQILTLKNVHRILLADVMNEKYSPFVEEAVQMFANDIRTRQNSIMEGLQKEMMSVPIAKEFWAKARSFYTYVPKRHQTIEELYNSPIHILQKQGAVFGDTEKGYAQIYHIWRWTDFRQRLLAALELDPAHFHFKLISYLVSENDKYTYHNTLMLVYSPRPIST